MTPLTAGPLGWLGGFGWEGFRTGFVRSLEYASGKDESKKVWVGLQEGGAGAAWDPGPALSCPWPSIPHPHPPPRWPLNGCNRRTPRRRERVRSIVEIAAGAAVVAAGDAASPPSSSLSCNKSSSPSWQVRPSKRKPGQFFQKATRLRAVQSQCSRSAIAVAIYRTNQPLRATSDLRLRPKPTCSAVTRVSSYESSMYQPNPYPSPTGSPPPPPLKASQAQRR